MKSILSLVAGLLTLVGCGSEVTPETKAKEASDFVKNASGGALIPVVKDVGSMANGTQDRP